MEGLAISVKKSERLGTRCIIMFTEALHKALLQSTFVATLVNNSSICTCAEQASSPSWNCNHTELKRTA